MQSDLAYKLERRISAAAISSEPRAWGWELLARELESPSLEFPQYALFCVRLNSVYQLPYALAFNLILVAAGYRDAPDALVLDKLRQSGIDGLAEVFLDHRERCDELIREGEKHWVFFNSRNEG